ncbi:MAG TPA: glycoside hydrolase family 15 protein [Bryobacteraceae bacterium]|nr:glycoside hydrolase family 15 protein [Bryobacteraceae bacterium]
MPYQPIEDYGIIGNLRTAALIAKTGSIDWLCFPHFDSPSIFGAILDQNKGGYFQISPTVEEISRKQVYWPDTNVLVTRFLAADGLGEIIDFMPLPESDAAPAEMGLIRRVRVVRGSMQFRLECVPAFNYGRDSHTMDIVSTGVHFCSPGLRLALASSVPLARRDNGVSAEFSLQEGESQSFQLHQWNPGQDEPPGWSEQKSEKLFHETIHFWRRWLSQCTYRGRWREMVQRSALALKLLTFAPTGAIVAAPTCSLPESLGGSRNWDYRYTWIRDAAFTVYSLLRIGFQEEAAQFVSFLDARCHELEPDGSLQTMYGIDGRHDLPEETLDHWEGYLGSRPVRIGNAAAQQLQLDIYGELMDSLYLYNKYATPISYELWNYLRRLSNWVCRHWTEKDDAIWEVRGGPREFVYSKTMCWVALDRALRLATKRSFPADWDLWTSTRDQIYEAIMQRGWNQQRSAFVQQFDGSALDASSLIMPLVFFVSPTDPRMLQTIDAINRSPADGGLVSDGLVFRYDVDKTPDGLKGTEGTFNLCTFWLVEALTRASHNDPERLQHARFLFEQILGYANHLGLYGEQIGHRGQALGNFPQALTHLALISAAFNLDRYLDGVEKTPPVQ